VTDTSVQPNEIQRWKCFCYGALGGFIPVLLTIIAIDVNAIILFYEKLNIGHYVGHGLKIGAMLCLGGLFALLNFQVKQPLTLVQLGIAAPAIFTTYMNAKAPQQPAVEGSFLSIISTAYAADHDRPAIVPAGFLKDVLDGATQRLDSAATKSRRASKNYFSITNRSNGRCIESSSTGNPQSKLRQLQGTFPAPAYQVKIGSCR